MNYVPYQGFAISSVMDTSALYESGISTLESYVTPSQQELLDRNRVMLDAMDDAIAEHAEDGGLLASSTVWNAKRLLQLLPVSMPATDSYVSEVESICFDWDEDLNCQLSLMVQKNDRIAYAASVQGDRFNGSIAFSHNGLPQEIVYAIERWQQRR